MEFYFRDSRFRGNDTRADCPLRGSDTLQPVWLPSAGFSHRGTGVGKQTRRLRYGEAPLDVIPTKVGIQ